MAVTTKDITSGYSTGLINDNFQLVEDELNNNVLRRNGLSSGEANHMEVGLDMNSNFVYNLPEPVLEHQAARLQDVQNALSGGSANLITFTPYGGLTSENVQAAIQELVDDAGSLEVTTSTGTKSIENAIDDRVFYIDSVADLLTIDLSTVQPGELKWIGTSELVIYVDAATGSDLNDGFESGSPKATLQSAIDRLEVFGPYLNGQFVIQLAAGTYARGRFPDDGLPSELPIIVRGPDVSGHPNVPTAIISEGASGVAADGILARNGTKLKIKDVKFTGWDGSSSVGGVQVTDAGELYTENCHFENCYWGASALNRSNLDVKGGIFDPCGTLNGVLSNGGGTRTLFNCRHAIGTQNAGTLTNGPIFRNSAKACFAQEGSTGHCDYATIEDCSRGLEANVNSRFNYSGTSFKRNTVDVFVHNSHVFADSPVYGTGADESSLRVLANNYGATGGIDYFTDWEAGNSVGKRTYAIDYVNTLYNSTTATAFHTSTLKAYMWRNVALSLTPGRAVNIKVTGALNGSNDVKRINLRMGAALAQLSFTATDSGVFEAEGTVYFTDRAEQFLTLRGYRHLSPSVRVGSSTASEALTADTALTVEAQVTNTNDSIRIYTVEASLLG